MAWFLHTYEILADFLFSFYLLTLVLKHATNHIQTRCASAKITLAINKNTIINLTPQKPSKFRIFG